jgi:hypothetical protein
MRRTSLALLAGLLILLPGAGRAADEGPAGSWKLSLYLPDDQHPPEKQLLWLVQLQSADGKWSAKVLDKLADAPEATVTDPKVADGVLRFTLTVGETPFQFEGELPKGDAKTISGSVSRKGQVIPVDLERTAIKSLDRFELAKEALPGATGFEATVKAMTLLAQAQDKKAKLEEVRSWAEKAYKSAEPYGARLHGDVTLEIAEMLAKQDDYADVAVNYARKAENSLGPKTKLSRVKRTLDALAAALKKAGKKDELKEVEARIEKLNPEIKPAAFAGRKAKSDRAVLVELFTGAQCLPCVAADKAFDALEKTYKPGEVVLLEYHEHIPGADPLTSPASEARLRYYFGQRGATPQIAFNGKPAGTGGGDQYSAIERYEEYQEAINPLLEEPAKAVLKASAVRKGNKVEITAEASEVDEPGNTFRLRLALVEESVEYKGGNGIPSFRHVVRDMPGGVTGVSVKDKVAKQSVTVDLDQLKKDLKKYLDTWAAENDEKFPGKLPDVELKNLRVVAFLQNDKTREVLQAVQVDVKSAE